MRGMCARTFNGGVIYVNAQLVLLLLLLSVWSTLLPVCIATLSCMFACSDSILRAGLPFSMKRAVP